MRNKSRAVKIVYVFFFCSFLYNSLAAQDFNYPTTPKEPVSDTIFGKVVVDNYRWMEDVSNSQMQTWLKAQTALTNAWLNKIPGRNSLIDEYKKLDQVTSNQLSLFIICEGGRYFYQKTLAGENVAKLYYRQGKNGKEVLLFDPHTYGISQSKEITFYFVPSKDGKKVALNLSESDKPDISSVKIINVDTKKLYLDTLLPGTSAQAWSPNSKGFLYSKLQTTDPLSIKLSQDISLKYHKLETDESEDKIVLSRINNPGLGINAADLLFINYSPDNKYLVTTLWSGFQDQNSMLFASASELENDPIEWRHLVRQEDQVRDAIIYKDNVYLVSRKDAPNFKVLVSPIKDLDVSHAQTLIPESKLPIGWFRLTKDYLLIQKIEGTKTFWEQYSFSSRKSQSIKLPFSGAPWIYSLNVNSNDCIINVLSWKQPLTRYEYHALSHQISISPFNTNPKYPGTDDILVEELEVKGHDGTMIPLSLFYNKHIKKDGKNIVYMTGYGSYGNGIIQYFNMLFLPLLNKGVIIAVTHPRGGGEKGYAWHMGGFKATKPNTWKDFISCGEYLIEKGYTSARHLIGEGTSAGGILIGRAITQRPDLFAAAINNVPLSNPLRGENRANGILDSKEFGTIKDSTEAMGLIEMDAYLHVLPGVKYPAVIAVAGINDTRVPAWQPAKFVAALQNANSSSKPILLLVNYDIGHGTDEKYAMYRNFANMFAFALWQSGHKDFQPLQQNQ